MGQTWFKLQNGSDVRGVALEGVLGEPVTLTPEFVRPIGYAFAQWLAEKKGVPADQLKVAVGHDSRLSAEKIKIAVFQGLGKAGCAMADSGLSSTPAMFMATVFENHAYDGSIMLTASHLPFNRNGLKFFTRDGGLEKADIKKILTIATETGLFDAKGGKAAKINLMDDYAASLVATIRKGAGLGDKPLAGLKIVVDAGNGAGGFFVDKVLKPLGANTKGSQFLDPDGNFPNHIPNPEEKEAMDAIISAVEKNGADLGIIFDTDVDRAGAVDKNGKPINRNRFIALMASIVLEEHPGTVIVTDSVTSTGLKYWIEEKLGGVHHRFKRGYKNVINESIRLNSEGGNVSDGLACYNLMRSYTGKKTVIIDGMALSIASLIACGGDTVEMAENAWFMIHNPHNQAMGDGDDLRDMAGLLDGMRDQLASVYSAKSKKSKDEILKLMDAETWMNGPQAKEAGFVDEVTALLEVAAEFDASRFSRPPAIKIQETTIMASATYHELKSAFPKAKAEFFTRCLDKDLTIDKARAEYDEAMAKALEETTTGSD